jgi:mannose-6-phosphate isomerase-like protein (cupin superfamily)
MARKATARKQPRRTVPPDDLHRGLAIAYAETREPHLGVARDTYTILLDGKDTDGRFCLIDMYVPPGGGSPPHRHDFEETFTLLDGELQATFRGRRRVILAGETLHVPANAPHQFHNSSGRPVRMLCICAPAGQEELFKEIGVPVATRTTAPPKLSQAEKEEFRHKVAALARKYHTELLAHA